jgi:hypothetical protein
MKKLLLCSLLSAFTLSGIYLPGADAKKVPPGLAKKPGQMPPGQYKKLHRNRKVYVTTPGVYVNPNPNVTVYTVPLTALNPGTYYFSTKAPAVVTIDRAKLKGLNTVLNFLNNRWVVQIR